MNWCSRSRWGISLRGCSNRIQRVAGDSAPLVAPLAGRSLSALLIASAAPQPRRLSAAEEEPILRARRETKRGPGRGGLSRARSTIWKVLWRHGLSRRPRGPRQSYRRDKAMVYWNAVVAQMKAYRLSWTRYLFRIRRHLPDAPRDTLASGSAVEPGEDFACEELDAGRASRPWGRAELHPLGSGFEERLSLGGDPVGRSRERKQVEHLVGDEARRRSRLRPQARRRPRR